MWQRAKVLIRAGLYASTVYAFWLGGIEVNQGLYNPLCSFTHTILHDKANIGHERSFCSNAVVGKPSGTTPIAR